MMRCRRCNRNFDAFTKRWTICPECYSLESGKRPVDNSVSIFQIPEHGGVQCQLCGKFGCECGQISDLRAEVEKARLAVELAEAALIDARQWLAHREAQLSAATMRRP